MPGKFKAIIVGAGPVGLAMANALALAGIDFIVLEKRENVVEETGFGLALWPHGVRILDQFDISDEATPDLRLRMEDHKYTIQPDGSASWFGNLYGAIERNHGHPWLLTRRQKLVELLYRRALERKAQIMTNRKFISIETRHDGVVVHCEDGTKEEGSIVVGCDGSYSRVRSIMHELASASGTKISKNDKLPMRADYQLLWAQLDPLPGEECKNEHGTLWETRDQGFSCQTFNFATEAYILMYQRLPAPTREFVRYSNADMEAFAAANAERRITRMLRLKDVWSARRASRLFNIEEGSMQTWHWGGRIVLVGDAVYKTTPNLGLSLNTGWQGVVELTNRLRALLLKSPEPDARMLNEVFVAYQRGRETAAWRAAWIAQLYLRVTAWHNVWYRILDWLGPIVGEISFLKLLATPIVKQGIVLDFVPEKNFKSGLVPWVNQPLQDEK